MTILSAEAPVTSTAGFYEEYKDELKKVFTVIEAPLEHLDSPERAVNYTQRWVKGDHNTPTYPISLTPEQKEALRDNFSAMDLTQEKVPPPGEYQGIAVLGGMAGINSVRAEYPVLQLARPDITLAENSNISFWCGGRAAAEREFSAIRDILIAARNADPDDRWSDRFIGNEHLVDEAVQGRLSFMAHFGRLVLNRIDLRIEDGESVRGHVFESEVLGRQTVKLVVMNARAVPREGVGGAPRHTTESCTLEWAESDYAPEGERPNVMFVTNNPHTRRTTGSVQDVLDRHGYDHINLIGCGPAAYEDASPSLFLGEIGRLLYADYMRRGE
jgi:hypothetical protein